VSVRDYSSHLLREWRSIARIHVELVWAYRVSTKHQLVKQSGLPTGNVATLSARIFLEVVSFQGAFFAKGPFFGFAGTFSHTDTLRVGADGSRAFKEARCHKASRQLAVRARWEFSDGSRCRTGDRCGHNDRPAPVAKREGSCVLPPVTPRNILAMEHEL